MIKENSIELTINQVSIAGDHVIKQYIGPGAFHRWQTELHVLTEISDTLPVPKILNSPNEAELTIEVVSGYRSDLILSSENSQKLFQNIGQTLKNIHRLPVNELIGKIPGNGKTLIHGDFLFQNIFFDPNSHFKITILDWEWAHLGEIVEDLAWMEWSIRMNFARYEKDIPIFYEAYGEVPDWQSRKDAMMMQCNRNLEFARMIGERKVIQQWQNRSQITKRMQPY